MGTIYRVHSYFECLIGRSTLRRSGVISEAVWPPTRNAVPCPRGITSQSSFVERRRQRCLNLGNGFLIGWGVIIYIAVALSSLQEIDRI